MFYMYFEERGRLREFALIYSPVSVFVGTDTLYDILLFKILNMSLYCSSGMSGFFRKHIITDMGILL
jgi:hypothetical protein